MTNYATATALKGAPYKATHAQQKGNVLITTLILMTMIAILGLNAIESVVLEQRMFSGYQNQNVAFNAAENAIKLGEQVIVGLANPAVTDLSQNYLSWDQDDLSSFVPIRVMDIDWGPYIQAGDIDGAQEAFLIQYLGQRPITGEELGKGQRRAVFGSRANFFRLGAYGEGPQEARRVVDVVYATLD